MFFLLLSFIVFEGEELSGGGVSHPLSADSWLAGAETWLLAWTLVRETSEVRLRLWIVRLGWRGKRKCKVGSCEGSGQGASARYCRAGEPRGLGREVELSSENREGVSSPKSADSSAPWSAWLAAGCVHLDEWRDFRYAFLGPIERRTKWLGSRAAKFWQLSRVSCAGY